MSKGSSANKAADSGPSRRRQIALAGNPNTGKTTVFNQLTGARARVGNYPGVTVERRLGACKLKDGTIDVLDLPGTYSLAARSAEEQIAMEALLGVGDEAAADLCVLVVDAGQLLRNLYLGLQLIELQIPVIIALNMVDEQPVAPDAKAISKVLGVPVIATSARSGEGIHALREAIEQCLANTPETSSPLPIAYPNTLDPAIEQIVAALPDGWRGDPQRERALALWALLSIDAYDELRGLPTPLREATLQCLEELQAEGDPDGDIVAARYRFLDQKVGPCSQSSAPDSKPAGPPLSDRIDAVVLHPVFGFVCFVALMMVVFQSLFSWSDPAIGWLEKLFGYLGTQAQQHLPAGFVADLASEGLVAGVGNVVVFLPQIALLFLLLGFLEDSGYMSRAAYLMDRLMRSVGLHGRAFVPMLSGCACAIPAVMATRTMERERDRLLTMLVVPLMTCSARLPVYTLIIAALFPAEQSVLGIFTVKGLMLFGMYLLSTVVTLVAASVIGRTVVKGRRVPLLMELPPYRLPTLRTMLRRTLERSWLFLKEAGTVILVCTIGLWALLSYPQPDEPRPSLASLPPAVASADTAARAKAQPPETATSKKQQLQAAQLRWQEEKMAQSYAGRMGRGIEPMIRPLGFDWKVGVGLIGAFAAREVFVSTMGIIYGIGGDVDEESKPLRTKISQQRHPDGRPVYTPLMGLSLMVFFAFACQCMSTLAVVKRETGGYKWPAFLFAYMTALAYAASFAVYQGGQLLGFG